jgi:hypothetical protein
MAFLALPPRPLLLRRCPIRPSCPHHCPGSEISSPRDTFDLLSSSIPLSASAFVHSALHMRSLIPCHRIPLQLPAPASCSIPLPLSQFLIVDIALTSSVHPLPHYFHVIVLDLSPIRRVLAPFEIKPIFHKNPMVAC